MSDKTTPERLLLIETRLSDLYHLEERVKRLEETLAATKPAMTMEEVAPPNAWHNDEYSAADQE